MQNLIFEAALLLGAAAGSEEASPTAGPDVAALDWSQDLFTALVESRRRGLPVLVYVYDKV